MTHHKYLGFYESDKDFGNIKKLKLEDELTTKTIVRHILTPMTGLHIPHYFGVSISLKDGYLILTLKIMLIVGIILFTWFEPTGALLFLIVPYVWIYTAINYWTDCIDHGGLLNSKDETTKSRNFVVKKWIRVIFFPRNDCFHLIHHLFPGVPVRHLDYCYKHLQGQVKSVEYSL